MSGGSRTIGEFRVGEVVAGAVREPPGLTTANRDDVQVAKQVEDNLAAVRVDVEIHPRAFVGCELDRSRRSKRGVDVPGPGSIYRGRVGECGGGRKKNERQEAAHEYSPER